MCYEGREALYGGSAGGGKSVAILAAALQYADHAGYKALILRRTYKQLAKADSILGKAKEWLLGACNYNGDEHKFTFPSGATLEFGHMEHADSMFDYQGGSWDYIGVDEATQFSGPMLAYPRTRQRRAAGSTLPLRWRGASNPGGIGHLYVKERFVKVPDGTSPCGPQRQYFPARLEDNPHIDRDEYVATLTESGIDPVTLSQLLEGNWDAIEGGRFTREMLRRYRVVGEGFGQGGEYLLGDRRVLRRECWRFMTVDPAATSEQTASERKRGDPDYTVIAVWDVTPRGDLVFADCHRFRAEIPDIVPQIQQMYSQHRPRFVAIEAVASNRAVLQEAQRKPMAVRELSPKGKDKLSRAAGIMTLARQGKFWLPDQAHWVDEIVTEYLIFRGDGKTHDDVIDCSSYAAELIDEFDGDAARPAALSGRAW